MIIRKDFYKQNTLDTAKSLLGKILCRKLNSGKILKGKIVETEAYTQEEPSCHAYCGITKRSSTLFMEGGILYVYFIYGMHYCVNIVTEKEGYGSAVLIRGIEPINFEGNTNGPAKLCKAMNITVKENKTDTTDINSKIWLEIGDKIEENQIIQTTRIGIKQATELPWRFYIKDNKWVSKK